MSKRAVILAGGKGTRLKPYTVAIPKPLVPIGSKPILELIILRLAECGFDHITITVNHLADVIKAFFMDGEKWGIKIDYSFEQIPLSTMGPLKLIEDLPDNFLIMNGDVLTDLDFASFFDSHIKHENLFTISSFRRTVQIDYGLLHVTSKVLSSFEEKPLMHYEVSMGVYAASRKILQFIPPRTAYGFNNLMDDLLVAHQPVRVELHEGYWLDIGRPEDYEKACNDYLPDGSLSL